MLRESSLITGKFVSSSNPVHEGNRNLQSLSSSSAINLRMYQKTPFKFSCFAISNTQKREFRVSNQLLSYLLNY